MKRPTSGRRSHQGESGMNKTALTTIAPDIYWKRLIVERYFRQEITEATLLAYFAQLTRELGLRTYADPIIHRTAGQGKAVNEGFDGFVPLGDATIVPLHFKVWGHYCESGEEILRDCCYDTDAQNLA